MNPNNRRRRAPAFFTFFAAALILTAIALAGTPGIMSKYTAQATQAAQAQVARWDVGYDPAQGSTPIQDGSAAYLNSAGGSANSESQKKTITVQNNSQVACRITAAQVRWTEDGTPTAVSGNVLDPSCYTLLPDTLPIVLLPGESQTFTFQLVDYYSTTENITLNCRVFFTVEQVD